MATNNYVREALRLASEYGWEVSRTTKGHLKFTSSAGTIYGAGTPGDRRSLMNLRADLRRAKRSQEQSISIEETPMQKAVELPVEDAAKRRRNQLTHASVAKATMLLMRVLAAHSTVGDVQVFAYESGYDDARVAAEIGDNATEENIKTLRRSTFGRLQSEVKPPKIPTVSASDYWAKLQDLERRVLALEYAATK